MELALAVAHALLPMQAIVDAVGTPLLMLTVAIWAWLVARDFLVI